MTKRRCMGIVMVFIMISSQISIFSSVIKDEKSSTVKEKNLVGAADEMVLIKQAIIHLKDDVEELEGSKDDYKKADAILKQEIQQEINTVKSTLEKQLNVLKGQISAPVDLSGINQSIKIINTLIEGLKVADIALDDKFTELIGEIQKELDESINNLDKALKSGDEDLSNKIEVVYEVVDEAIKNLEKTDANNKEQLTKVIETSDAELNSKIEALNKLYEDEKKELVSSDTKNKTELINKVDEAYKSLLTAITTVKEEFNDKEVKLREKDKKLEVENKKLEAKDKTLEEKDKLLKDKDKKIELKMKDLQNYLVVVGVISLVAICISCGVLIKFMINKK